MLATDVLQEPARVLKQAQREKYFRDGYLSVGRLVTDEWLDRLRSVTLEFVEISCSLDKDGIDVAGKKDKRFDLEPDHSEEAPRIRRLNAPIDVHETYWSFASEGPFVEVAQDLLGPDVKFHHSKLNFKWSHGGEEVKWHQDIQFWPHTNYDVLTLGVYLEDVAEDMAPMGVIPGSHEGTLYDLYDHEHQWTGSIRDEDVPTLGVETAEYIGGRAGTITVHNCRSIHGSPPNMSGNPRPLLLCAYSRADAFPITNLTNGGKHSEEFVAGGPSRWARFDPRPVLMPPDWSKTEHKSIFEHQQREAYR